jgi:hypothetical protein
MCAGEGVDRSEPAGPHPNPPPQGGRELLRRSRLLPSPSWGGVGGGGPPGSDLSAVAFGEDHLELGGAVAFFLGGFVFG